MDHRYKIQIPKLLILAQKRSGSHFLQDSIKCAALTGTTFLHHLRDGGKLRDVSSLYRLKNTKRMSVQVLRYHNFSTRESDLIQWLTFSDYLISQTPKIVILGRKDLFMQALTDWFNDTVFDREVKRKNPHEEWTDYRENLIRLNSVDAKTYAYYYMKMSVFRRLFRSLYVGYEEKCHHIDFEDFSDVVSVVRGISDFAGFDVGINSDCPVWQPADYSQMPGFKELKDQYANR
ncbi:MAG: hypothetical protein OXH00_02770 [Candidatus Poribacteria bacterium]|nr:hypothetical protein [Candidatus Poribacteria bacterium]